jgi:hypothetical protein
MKIFTVIRNFIRNKYIAFLITYTAFLAHRLDKSLQHLGRLDVLDLSTPLLTVLAPPRPSPPAPEPAVSDVWVSPNRRIQIQVPYVLSWVAASFKDPTKHPGYRGTKLVDDPRERPDFIQNKVAVVENEVLVIQAEPVIEEASIETSAVLETEKVQLN